jgi:choline dehydrogenase-like flavoprotein
MKIYNSEIVVIGSGAGGATVAKELSIRGKKVIVVEKGKLAKKVGNEMCASNFYEGAPFLVRASSGVIFHFAKTVGGTTVFSCGNGVRSPENIFSQYGIDLQNELNETESELNIMPIDEKLIGNKGTKDFLAASTRLGYRMEYMPKFMKQGKCSLCGKCVLGCPNNARWTAVDFINIAITNGTSLLEGILVEKILIKNKQVIGVEGRKGVERVIIHTEKVVLAAGGINTPIILQNSGLSAGKKLFCDLFNVTYAVSKRQGMANDLSMALVDLEFFKNDGFIVSPFIDPPLTFFLIFNKFKPLFLFKRKHVVGVEIKIKDDAIGSVSNVHGIKKTVTINDKTKLDKGVAVAKDILNHMPIDKNTINTSKIRAAHPGGTAAIGEVVNSNLETEVKNLYVCDASVLPEALGLPPIITLIALAKWFVKKQF